MNAKPDLSIVVATYNHEKFVSEAIESILKQKTHYSYEVWIGDDCSSDNTQLILRDYMHKTPDNFHYILRKKNIGADQNFSELYSKTNGRYLIVLEGDDYWIDDNKIEFQLNFLETHKEYFAIAHNTLVIGTDGKIRQDYSYPECKKNLYTLKDFQKGIYAGQTTTIMSRNYYKYYYFDIFKPSVKWAGDRTRNFMFASYGKVFCEQKVRSAYRYINDSGDSYSANFKKNKDTEYNFLIYHRELALYAKKCVNTQESIKVSESLYFKFLVSAYLKKKVDHISFLDVFHEFIKLKYKIYDISYIFNAILKDKMNAR